MSGNLFKLRGLACAVALAAGCSFDMYEHPTACKEKADCGEGYYCYQDFCVQQQGATDGGGGAGGSDDGGSMSGAGGDSGAGGSSGTGGDNGTGGSAGQGGGTNDAGELPDATADAAGLDSNVPAPPYAPCNGNGDCNPGETCRMADGKGVCAESCTSASDCPTPAGSFTAEVTCGADDDQCRLNCAVSVGGGGPPMARTCPSGMTCVTEPAEFGWQLGTSTCYP